MPSVRLSPCPSTFTSMQLELYSSCRNRRKTKERDETLFPIMFTTDNRCKISGVIIVIYWSQEVTASKPYLRPTQTASRSLPNLDPTGQNYPTTAVMRCTDETYQSTHSLIIQTNLPLSVASSLSSFFSSSTSIPFPKSFQVTVSSPPCEVISFIHNG